MPDGPVVVNTSPLIALDIIGLVDILRAYDEVIVPAAVVRELDAGGAGRPGHGLLDRARFLVVASPRGAPPPDLGPGEGEAIALADERRARFVVLDDRVARTAARLRGLRVAGTLGLLGAAKRRGDVPALAPLLVRLAEAGFRLPDDLVDALLREVGEPPLR